MKFFKKIYKVILQSIIIGSITLLLFEFIYRYAIIDFYKVETNALNSNKDLVNEEIDFLIFGDSFSAAANNYVSLLREQYLQKSFINKSVPGTGIKQVNTYVKKIITKYKPKIIIYQVYVGNDLLDVKHLSNWKKLSSSRNLYWEISDYFMSLTYLNQKAKGLNRFPKKNNFSNHQSKEFNTGLYNAREKLLLKADAYYLDKTISLKDDFLNRYNLWRKELDVFINKIPKQTKVYIVFIPHCSQVNDYYFNNQLALNAIINDKNTHQKNNYIFFKTAKQDFINYKNVEFINPLSYLKKKDSLNHRLYYANDPHFNNLGHKEFSNYLKTRIFN